MRRPIDLGLPRSKVKAARTCETVFGYSSKFGYSIPGIPGTVLHLMKVDFCIFEEHVIDISKLHFTDPSEILK